MEGMDRIKERILEDAKKEAEGIIADANKRADEIRKNSEDKASERAAGISADYETRASELKTRLISSAQMEMRKRILAVKQDIIGKAFDYCFKSILELPQQEYEAMMGDLMISAVQTGDEEVVLSHRDAARLGDRFVAGVNSRLSASGRLGALKYYGQKGEFDGGFILKKGGVEINCTLEALLRSLREDIEPQTAEVLF